MTHLSEDALNDVLIGMASDESNEHLAGCEFCRSRVENFGRDMDLFNRTSLAWSESASLASAHPMIPRPKSHRLTFLAIGLATAIALLLAVATPLWHGTSHSWSNEQSLHAGAPGVSGPEDSEAQIAQDNNLLKAVNEAINPEEVSPLNEYHLLEKPHSRSRARMK